MEMILHLLLLLSGLCTLSSCEHKYVLVSVGKTWFEAQRYCRETCVDLATIDDMGEMETALKVVGGQYTEGVWLGLRKWGTLKAEWHWSLANKDFYKEGERNYFSLDTRPGYNCMTYREGKGYQTNCGNEHYSICFDGQKQGEEQYVLTSQKMHWTAAQDYCRTHHTDLASVRNDVENQMIQEKAGALQVWIGLSRDPWEWSDQTYSSFRYWKEGHPVWTDLSEKACVVMLKSESGKWGPLPCGRRYRSLCSCPIVTSIQVRISPQGSELDLNDPAVHDDILTIVSLKQIKCSVCTVNY